jgi:hypothetical protein
MLVKWRRFLMRNHFVRSFCTRKILQRESEITNCSNFIIDQNNFETVTATSLNPPNTRNKIIFFLNFVLFCLSLSSLSLFFRTHNSFFCCFECVCTTSRKLISNAKKNSPWTAKIRKFKWHKLHRLLLQWNRQNVGLSHDVGTSSTNLMIFL